MEKIIRNQLNHFFEPKFEAEKDKKKTFFKLFITE